MYVRVQTKEKKLWIGKLICRTHPQSKFLCFQYPICELCVALSSLLMTLLFPNLPAVFQAFLYFRQDILVWREGERVESFAVIAKWCHVAQCLIDSSPMSKLSPSTRKLAFSYIQELKKTASAVLTRLRHSTARLDSAISRIKTIVGLTSPPRSLFVTVIVT